MHDSVIAEHFIYIERRSRVVGSEHETKRLGQPIHYDAICAGKAEGV